MKNVFTPFEKRKLSAKNLALLNEWKEIDELCNNRNQVSYKIVKLNKDDLPVEYEITYEIPSFIGLQKDKKIDHPQLEEKLERKELFFHPEFGKVHKMQIIVPPNFPQISGKPKGKIISKIWHPNVVCHGDGNILGRVCFNEGNLDASVTIADRILQVAEYLTYYNYLAEEREPHPYDTDVAYWIREIAEPMGWVVQDHGIIYEKFDIAIQERASEPPKPQDVNPAAPSKPEKDTEILILDDDSESEGKPYSGDWSEFKEPTNLDEEDEILSL
jgi:hypothetical protein